MTTRKSNAGRKPLLTPEVKAEFFNARALGRSLKRSGELAGISETTITNWLARGREASTTPASKRDDMDVKCLEFLTESEKIGHEWIRRCEIILALSMSPGDSRAIWAEAGPDERREATATAKWKLSHQAANEYSTQNRTELTGADGGPIDLEVEAMGREILSSLRFVKAYEDALDEQGELNE